MIAHVWENKVFENKKEKCLRKILDRNRNRDQNQFPKDSIFLWFFQSLKKNKKNLFGTKTLQKLAAKH